MGWGKDDVFVVVKFRIKCLFYSMLRLEPGALLLGISAARSFLDQTASTRAFLDVRNPG